MSNFEFIATIEDELIFYYGEGNNPDEALASYLAGTIWDSMDGIDGIDQEADVVVSSVDHHQSPCTAECCEEEHEEFWIEDYPCKWIVNQQIKTVRVIWDYDEEKDEVTNLRIKEVSP